MSTFLEICQDVARECDLAGGDTVPTTVVGQSGELQKVVKWVIQAYKEIQNKSFEWRWMRVGFTFDTVADQDNYAYTAITDVLTAAMITRFSTWRVSDWNDPPKYYLTANGVGSEGILIFQSWDNFKFNYELGTQNNNAPTNITVNPQNEIVLGAKPNDVYTISGDYQRSIQTLDITDDDDVPDMPAAYHDLIMWGAVIKYGLSVSASEVVTKGQFYYGPLMAELEQNQLPPMTTAGPMV